MKDLLELVRKRYQELNKRLEAAKQEVETYDQNRERLSLEFTIADNQYEDACEHFDRIERRINKKQDEFIQKQLLTHKKTLLSAGLSVATVGIGIGMLTGAIVNPLFLPIIGSITIAGLIDLKSSWKRMKLEIEERFENLESTKRIREVSDKAYVRKLQAEKNLRNVQGEIITNTRNLNLAKAKQTSIENEMMGVKVDTFDLIVDEQTDAKSLILK